MLLPRIDLSGEKGRFAYAGGGYQIAQLWAEDVSGEPFAAIAQRLILGPLGMTRSTFAQPIDDADIAPLPVAAADSPIMPMEGVFWPMEGSWRDYPELAAAGLWTTAPDYLRFVAALLSAAGGEPGPVIDAETARFMLTVVDEDYGLGVMVRTDADGTVTAIGHTGGNTGYRSLWRGYPGANAAAVIIANNRAANALLQELGAGADAAFGGD
jgi:CubicO group peptidase (beta-lactamase class C family)